MKPSKSENPIDATWANFLHIKKAEGYDATYRWLRVKWAAEDRREIERNEKSINTVQ